MHSSPHATSLGLQEFCRYKEKNNWILLWGEKNVLISNLELKCFNFWLKYWNFSQYIFFLSRAFKKKQIEGYWRYLVCNNLWLFLEVCVDIYIYTFKCVYLGMAICALLIEDQSSERKKASLEFSTPNSLLFFMWVRGNSNLKVLSSEIFFDLKKRKKKKEKTSLY